MNATAFLLSPVPLPAAALHHGRRSLLDAIGTGWGGRATPCARIAADHAAHDMPGPVPIPWDGRGASAMGAAFAAGACIDALDGHDGNNLTKGHASCTLLAGLLAGTADDAPAPVLLDAFVRGHEVANRAGVALHATAAGYHTSGAWAALGVAGALARLEGLDAEATDHALGLAEYHGPRSPMMRCIDHPAMVKDGAAMGALAGVQAARLAARGFTAPPSGLAEHEAFRDLGTRWWVGEQYFKPWPVCRWAQPPVEAALALRADHDLSAADVEAIRVETFHEALRLAARPVRTTEEAQYSTGFPVAVALLRGAVGPADVTDGLDDPALRRLAAATTFAASPEADAAFPAVRQARIRLTLRDGRVVESGWHRPRWDAEAPPSDAALVAKLEATCAGTGGDAGAIRAAVINGAARDVGALRRLVTPAAR